MVYAYIYSKRTSFFLQNAHLYSKIINKNQTKQYICEQINIDLDLDLFQTQIS